MKAAYAILVATLVTVGCGSSGDGSSASGAGDGANRERIVWAEIAPEHHPEIAKQNVTLAGVETIKTNLFGFDGDFVLLYDAKMPAGQGAINVYRVWKESASYGSTSIAARDGTLTASSSGTYECSIRVENRRITQLKGGCIVRVEVVLPVGSEIEVYNLDQLKSRRFKAMTNAAMLENVRRAYRDEQRLAAIEDYLNSYRETGKRPALTAPEVGRALHDFPFKDGKMTVLRKLHAYVADRESLRAMIDAEFTYFDRADARAVVGLP